MGRAEAAGKHAEAAHDATEHERSRQVCGGVRGTHHVESWRDCSTTGTRRCRVDGCRRRVISLSVCKCFRYACCVLEAGRGSRDRADPSKVCMLRQHINYTRSRYQASHASRQMLAQAKRWIVKALAFSRPFRSSRREKARQSTQHRLSSASMVRIAQFTLLVLLLLSAVIKCASPRCAGIWKPAGSTIRPPTRQRAA